MPSSARNARTASKASLAGYDLPTDETLAAHANVCARASSYKDSGVFAGVRMDQFRAMAYLDILNGIPAEARIACGQPPAGLGATNDFGPDNVPGTPPDGEDPEDPPSGPGGEPPSGSPPSDGSPPDGASPPPRPADLVFPLKTLLGLADRPGEGHGLGPLDPDLCRALASLAARVNLTITTDDLAELAGTVAHGTWTFTRTAAPGPPGGYGVWELALPDGRRQAPGPRPAARLSCRLPEQWSRWTAEVCYFLVSQA